MAGEAAYDARDAAGARVAFFFWRAVDLSLDDAGVADVDTEVDDAEGCELASDGWRAPGDIEASKSWPDVFCTSPTSSLCSSSHSGSTGTGLAEASGGRPPTHGDAADDDDELDALAAGPLDALADGWLPCWSTLSRATAREREFASSAQDDEDARCLRIDVDRDRVPEANDVPNVEVVFSGTNLNPEAVASADSAAAAATARCCFEGGGTASGGSC